MLNVENHWKPDPDPAKLGWSVFDFEIPMVSHAECGAGTEGGKFEITAMASYETECCPECWKLALR